MNGQVETVVDPRSDHADVKQGQMFDKSNDDSKAVSELFA